ncbi:MAG: radical SAM protein [Candidatus Saganbacteria bacterium]|nr:radical SAM protein [Candidatus Saganbacteria bacterium]
MRILIVVPRMRLEEAENYNYMFPLGLAYLSSVLKQAGHQVACFNLNHYYGAIPELLNNYIKKHGPFEVACTGGISTSYRQIKAVVEAFHAGQPEIKLILGGGLISSEPELMFSVLSPDFIVLGEGEETICELISYLEKQGEIGRVAGIGYRDQAGQIILTKARAPIADIDSLPWPDFESFEYDKYLEKMRPSDYFGMELFDQPRVYPIICSRSCPYSCTFCYHPIGQKYRQRSIKSIMEELSAMVKRYRINLIWIYDELFSDDREWLAEFCRQIKILLKEISWPCKWGCQMRVDKLDEPTLKAMKEAGCYSISYGFESYSPAVLKSMKKRITAEQIDRAVRLTLKNKISLQANFIFGDPAETRQTIKETLSYWKANREAGIMLNFISPYPGTPLYQKCLGKGIIKDKIDFIENRIFGLFNMSDSLTDRAFARLWYEINKAVIKDRVYAKKWKAAKAKDGTFSLSVECPHCKTVSHYGNYVLKSKYYYFAMMYCRACARRFFLSSSLFKFTLNVLLAVYTLMPVLSYRFYEQIWPRRYLIRGAFNQALNSLKRAVGLGRVNNNV